MHEINAFINSNDHDSAKDRSRIGMDENINIGNARCAGIKNFFGKAPQYSIECYREYKHQYRLGNDTPSYFCERGIPFTAIDHDIPVADPDDQGDPHRSKILGPGEIRWPAKTAIHEHDRNNET